MDTQLPGSVRLLIISVSLISAIFTGMLWYWSLLLAAVLLIVSRMAQVRNQRNPSRLLEFLELSAGFNAMGILVLMAAFVRKSLDLSGRHNLLLCFNIALITTFIVLIIPWKRLWDHNKVSVSRIEGESNDLENGPGHE